MTNAVSVCYRAEALQENLPAKLGLWAVRLHFRVYRACCAQLRNLACCALQQAGRPLAAGLQKARQVSVFDYGYTTALRSINAVFQNAFEYELISSDSLRTLKQKEREEEIKRLQKILGEHSIYSKFSRDAACYIGEVIPNVAGEKLESLPGVAEGWTLYRLGLPLRYFNYQLIKKTGYREQLISSQFATSFKKNYCAIRTRLAHFVLGKHNLDPVVNFEHLILQLLVKVTGGSRNNLSKRCIRAAVHSLAYSFSQQEQIDRYLASLPLRSDEEALIARLEWHKDRGSLPKGVPDPRRERLTTSNLYEKFDEALYEYLEGWIQQLIDRCVPSSIKSGFSGLIYFLEGRDAAVQLLTYLAAEFGIKQLTDPHLFALAILYACNEDIMDYELDGFGRNQQETIISVGQSMMNAMLEKKMSWNSTLMIFEESGLKVSPGGLEGILQKRAAKEHLRRYVASIIHEMIKEEEFQHKGGVLKRVRRKAKKVPIVGVATISLHALISGMFFSFRYPFRDTGQEDTPFLQWMFRHMAGKGLCNFLADRVVELIYHPSWRITLMQILNAVCETCQSDQADSQETDELISRKEFRNITDFLVQHFVRDKERVFGGNTRRLFDFFAGESVFREFNRCLTPSDEPLLLEKGLEALLPTMKELLLYCRVVDGFRKEGVCFEGDAKFWELFLRESLTRLVEKEARRRFPSTHQPSVSELTVIREEFIDGLLSLDTRQLRAYFSLYPNGGSVTKEWEVISGPEPVDGVHFSSAAPLNIASMIQWDYFGEGSNVWD